jgi:hypothetical protein
MGKKSDNAKNEGQSRKAKKIPPHITPTLWPSDGAVINGWDYEQGDTFRALDAGLKLVLALTENAEQGIDDTERYIIMNFCSVMQPRLAEVLDDLQLEKQPIINKYQKHFEEMRTAAMVAIAEVDKRHRPNMY